mmetsp:Transcript_101354/g.275499  ORF Transcript_101354/g.275499 Transcript_101354/m.275499 type:complete len:231 (+) Transcript_101354:584-1276(+)
MNTWEKFSGLSKYSDIIKCFSQFMFSRSHSLSHHCALLPFFSQSLICHFVSCGCVFCHRTTIACLNRREWSLLVARMERSQRGRDACFFPQSPETSMSTACKITIPPCPLGRASTTRPSFLTSHSGRSCSSGRPRAPASGSGVVVVVGGRGTRGVRTSYTFQCSARGPSSLPVAVQQRHCQSGCRGLNMKLNPQSGCAAVSLSHSWTVAMWPKLTPCSEHSMPVSATASE